MSKNSFESIVTEIQPITQQIGEHILAALQRKDDTMAVLTTIVPSLGPDRVVSLPISQTQFLQIQAFLHQEQLMQMEAQNDEEQEEERAIGFELPNNESDESESK